MALFCCEALTATDGEGKESSVVNSPATEESRLSFVAIEFLAFCKILIVAELTITVVAEGNALERFCCTVIFCVGGGLLVSEGRGFVVGVDDGFGVDVGVGICAVGVGNGLLISIDRDDPFASSAE